MDGYRNFNIKVLYLWPSQGLKEYIDSLVSTTAEWASTVAPTDIRLRPRQAVRRYHSRSTRSPTRATKSLCQSRSNQLRRLRRYRLAQTGA